MAIDISSPERRAFRAQRMADLKAELAQLTDEEAQDHGANADHVALREECIQLKRLGDYVKVCMHYKTRTGCTMKDAQAFVDGLPL
ncbi:hypothetical protein ABIC83_003035 [Roseateles asaccharophilus]|uniref:hypothetical protein n=1 Tax=Roseateles asaccharophilus TaxID=582607 RepID=UPI003837574C